MVIVNQLVPAMGGRVIQLFTYPYYISCAGAALSGDQLQFSPGARISCRKSQDRVSTGACLYPSPYILLSSTCFGASSASLDGLPLSLVWPPRDRLTVGQVACWMPDGTT